MKRRCRNERIIDGICGGHTREENEDVRRMKGGCNKDAIRMQGGCNEDTMRTQCGGQT